MQSCSVKLVRNRLIYCTTFASTLHNDMLSIKESLYFPAISVQLAYSLTGPGEVIC